MFVYLDNATTRQPSQSVIDAMLPYYREKWGAAGAPHDLGQDFLPQLDEHFQKIYSLLGATEADSFVLTSSGAEAINHVLMGCYLDLTRESGQNHFITSSIDEAPALMGIGRLEQLGCVGKMLEVGAKGHVSKEDVADAITPRTALVSLSWANALTGVVNPVHEISEVCEDRGIFFHVEASQVLGCMDVELAGIDLLSFNGDSIHGPKGTGGLWMRHGVQLSPYIVGGSDQAGRRAGNLNTAGLAGLAKAAEEAQDSLDHVCMETARLRDRFETEILRIMPEAQICFRDAERVPHTSCIIFPGVANEALLYALNKRQVYAGIGGGSFQQISLVLTEASFDEEMAHCAVSFSLSRNTTEEEIDKSIQAIDESLHQLKRMSGQCFEAGGLS